MILSDVISLVESFADGGDGAAQKSKELVLGLLANTPQPFSRNQFEPGHITGTGLVLHPAGESVLLVHHRRLDRWLLPGGHVESGDGAVWETARREVIEETGVLLAPNARPVLAGIDVHGIPPKGHEPFHLHHDLIFGFRAVTGELQCSEESRAVVWCPPVDFGRYDVPEPVRFSLRRICF